MNVNDEYDKQFLNQYQTLFLSDKLTNGTPGEKADVYRRLMGQLQLARNHGRLSSDNLELLLKEYWRPYTAIVDTHNTEQGLNNFAEGALSICSKYRNESQKWKSSLSLEKVQQMESYKKYLADVKDKQEKLLPEGRQSEIVIKSRGSRDQTTTSKQGGPAKSSFLASSSGHLQGRLSDSLNSNRERQHPRTMRNPGETGGNDQPFGSFNQRPPTFGNTSVAAGSGRNQMVGGGVKQSGNRRPLFGNGGKMYGERENVNPFSNHFGEEKPFQNRQVREESNSMKRPYMDDGMEGPSGQGQNDQPSFSGPFRTAKEQLNIENQKKFGRGRGTVSTSSYGATKKSLGTRWKTPDFDPSQIRLLLYSELDGNRSILFDSKSVIKVEEKQSRCSRSSKCHRRETQPNTSPNTSAGENSCPRYQAKYQLTKPCSDFKTLEEVLFGSVGMAQKGSSLKVHFLWSQMLLTKVFIPTTPKQESLHCDLDLDQSYQSQGEQTSPRLIYQPEKPHTNDHSVPMDVPDRIATFDIYDRDSGLASLTSSGSFHTPFPSPSSNASSYSSMHRRWMRSMATSFEGIKKRNSQDNLAAQDAPNSLGPQPGCRKRKSKLALGIVFGGDQKQNEQENLIFQNFFFSHITLIEGHLEKLKMAVEKAYCSKNKFVDIVMEALEIFRGDIMDLYTTPRLSEPVWLSMMSHPSYRYQICETFMRELVSLINKFDSKNNEFFMSTLVTAVLTHHLAWVPTVTPAGGTPSKTYLHNHSAKWVDTLAKTHPYNPLWAQLGDMYGAIGYPLKIARTIIVGKKADIVRKILYILSYFIRCSDVHENSELGSLKSFLEDISLEAQEEDKTPVQEGFKFPAGADEKLENYYNNSNSVINVTDSGTHDVHSSGDFNRSVDRKSLKLDLHGHPILHEGSDVKRNNEVESSLEMNQDEGYCSIVQSEDGEKIKCRLSTDNVVENVRIETVKNVNRAITSRTNEEKVTNPANTTSVFSSKLSHKEATVKTPSTADIKHLFLSERSLSMFNEYMDDDSIETKTIDEVPEDKRVVIHPAIRDLVTSQSLECLSEASEMEVGGTHQRRLGSVGQTARPKVSPLSRQISSELSKPSTYNPGRCRSVTPTELNRRRHLSSTSSFDFDHMDPLVHFKELSMPSISSEKNSSIKMFDRNFGRSLLADFSDHYLSNFVLHGTSDTNFKERLIIDLHMATQHPVLDEPITEAVFIVADTDKWTVDIMSSKSSDQPPKVSRVVASQLVCNMMDAVQQLHKLKMSSEFCLMHLEDRLQEIYFKSIMLAEYLRDSKNPGPCDIKGITKLLGFDAGDLPLLVAIAGTHSPHLSLGVV